MYILLRNNQQFGPYTLDLLASYVENGQILKCDEAFEQSNPQDIQTVGYFLKQNKKKVKVKHKGSLINQLKDLGTELIFPKTAINKKHLIADKRLMVLAIIGLLPSFLMFFISFFPDYLIFYSIALYFSLIWGLFFYYFFKTPQVSFKSTIILFFLTQLFVFLAWDLLGIPNLNPFYLFLEKGNLIFSLIGYIFGVGLTEELAKALPLFVIIAIAKKPLIPQTLVFYGLMSGIAFGVFEGVQYQTGVNIQLDYSSGFYMNIARLTSLPFLHATWCGIAGYFISFAKLYPKYRLSLYFLSIMIPALLHGIYDTFCVSMLGMLIAFPITFIGVVLLMTYLKQGVNNQSKLTK
jgi:Predicted membrane protein